MIGQAAGERPPLGNQGYWMYAGAEPVVHLLQKKPGETVLGPGTGKA